LNIRSNSTTLSTVKQPDAKPERATAGNRFGTVFNLLIAGNQKVVAPVKQVPEEASINNAIQSILNATSVEEITEILGFAGDEKLLATEQLEGLIDMNPEEFMENLHTLFKQAGLNESEIETVAYSNDFWSLLNVIDNVGPKFFAELTHALEGKGAVPVKQAVELLALLKSIALAAPDTDLIMKTEQQVFALQSFLAGTSDKYEAVVNSNQSRHSMLQLMDASNPLLALARAGAGQNQSEKESLDEKTKEMMPQNVTHNLSTMRSDASVAEIENRNNKRNETLLREMQNLFKRSNFGQAGGTNRLLIKLYPEHLGQVRIELMQVNGVMTARILASTALGKEMLDSQSHQLRAAFIQQNIQVERIDISQTLQDTTRNDRDQAFNQHFRKEQEESTGQNNQNQEEEMTFQEYMIELEA